MTASGGGGPERPAGARKPTRARALTVAFFALYAVAVTWPGFVPFNRIRPLVLGLPFSMAWVTLWIVGGALVLWMLDRAERRSGRR